MDSESFRKILGVNSSSTPGEIKKSYKALVRRYHPDNSDTGNEDKFREIHHAYKMLTDASYAYKETPKIQPVILKTSITLEQAVFGFTVVNQLTKLNVCVNKEGAVESEVNHKVIELIDVIPKGTLKFPHAVMRSGVDFGGGDKLTVISTYLLEDHPYYKVTPEGQIYINIEIEALQAMKGAKIDVETLFGTRKLRVPAGTVPGDSLLIKKHGHLPPLMVKISGIKYPRKAQMQGNSDYNSLDINWESEDALDKKEQEDLDELFNKLGGKPTEGM